MVFGELDYLRWALIFPVVHAIPPLNRVSDRRWRVVVPTVGLQERVPVGFPELSVRLDSKEDFR